MGTAQTNLKKQPVPFTVHQRRRGQGRSKLSKKLKGEEKAGCEEG